MLNIQVIGSNIHLTKDRGTKIFNIFNTHEILAFISPLYFLEILINTTGISRIKQILVDKKGIFGR
jgi:hypothetical protein